MQVSWGPWLWYGLPGRGGRYKEGMVSPSVGGLMVDGPGLLAVPRIALLGNAAGGQRGRGDRALRPAPTGVVGVGGGIGRDVELRPVIVP